MHAWCGRIEFADLKRRAIELYDQWRPQAVLIEDTASGQSLLQELGTDAALPIKGVKPDADKLARAVSVTPTIEAGGFRLVEGARWFSVWLTICLRTTRVPRRRL